MKIAFLIAAHDSPSHLKLLVEALVSSQHEIFIHIDHNSDIKTFAKIEHENVHFLSRRTKVYWGGFSQVKATLLLITEAVKFGSFDYFVLLSGKDYPTRSNNFIDDFFEINTNSNFINVVQMPGNGKSLDRIENFYFEQSIRFPLFRKIITYLAKVFPLKRKIPRKGNSYIPYGGSTWWALNEGAIQYIMQFIERNPVFANFFKYSHCPDEMFFQTILANSAFRKSLKPAIFYADFPKGSPHPSLISNKHLKELLKSKISTTYGDISPLIARKFNENSSDLIKTIDKTLRVI